MRSKIFLFLTVLIIIGACKEKENTCPASFINKQDDRLVIKNNHPFDIVHQFSFQYPDTHIYNADPIMNDSEYNKTLTPGESQRLSFNACWENIFKQEIKSDTLLIFSYHLDSLKLYGWDYLVANYLVLDRKPYSLKDLRNNNWLIELP